MPRTVRPTSRTAAGRIARWLAAAPLVAVLAACGGGGGGSGSGTASSAAQSEGDLGGSPPAEGSGQPDDTRTGAGGNQGGFNAAGQVSANASGTWALARIGLSSPRKGTFSATVSQVTDCTGGKQSAPATPDSQPITVVDGNSPTTADFTLTGPTPPAGSERTICVTVTVDGASSRVTAGGAVDVPDNTPADGNSDEPGTRPTDSRTSDSGTPDSGTSDGGTPDGEASEQPAPLAESASPR
ncbi:hypothetical protein [Streptomyces sp. TLI_171]|uniref:hypothetical protein n=1 Tax=Streptomyces sp. TLI_171 TaxID=1938859 RepID=UPI000C620ACF|nr:hypothetical protein [Streptomyces sp. TLI_171]RKE23574.1 hypothetical protein BX266_7049 [Streptomyces sp. TLI_171]